VKASLKKMFTWRTVTKYTVVPVALRPQGELIGPEWFGRQPAMAAIAPKCYNRNGDLCLP
jgi:hypothetical protein